MPLLTELVIFWLMTYKDAAPTALKFLNETRTPIKPNYYELQISHTSTSNSYAHFHRMPIR